MSVISLPEVPAQWWGQRDSPLCVSWPAPHFFSQTPRRWTPPQRCETPQCSTGLGWRTRPGEPAPQHSPLQEETVMFSHRFTCAVAWLQSHLSALSKAPGTMSCSLQSTQVTGLRTRLSSGSNETLTLLAMLAWTSSLPWVPFFFCKQRIGARHL